MKRLIIVLILAAIVVGGIYFYQNLTKLGWDSTVPRPPACTAEAKICPDGSAVGRVGPNCEFAACPAS